MQSTFLFLVAFVAGVTRSTYTIQTTNNLYFCKKTTNSIELSTSTDSTCKTMMFSIHAHSGGLVLNFKDETTCKYMCIDRCGQLYYDEMFYTEDCVYTTMAFEAFDQLSVNRGNHSDFIATVHYEIVPFTLRRGAYQERFEPILKLLVKKDTTDTASCAVGNVDKNTKTTKQCTSASHKWESKKFNRIAGYKAYSAWDKFLIFIGWSKVVVPLDEGLRRMDYNLNYMNN